MLSSKLDEVNASYVCEYNSIPWDFHVFHSISSIYHLITHFFEKYVRIKIEDHKILALMKKLSLTLDEINTSYVCKYNSIRGRLTCTLSIYHIIMHFFEKYIRIKIEDYKILVLLSGSSRKLDKPNTRYLHKYNWTLKLINFNIQVYLKWFLVLNLSYFYELSPH